MKEVVSINIGQAGIQLSNAAWELFCMEHGIRSDGFHVSDDIGRSNTTFFQQVNDRYVPRCLTLDFEPTVLDEVRVGVYRNLFNKNFLISGYEDASSNFARGCFTLGKKFIKSAVENIRRLVENCESLQGFCILNSYDGGTGSGFTSLLEEEISIEFSKISKFQLGILPSHQLASSTVYPYNTLLHTYYTISYTDLSPILDNQSIYNICSNKLKTERPSFTNINRIIAQIFSNITVSLRFENSINSDLDQLRTNIIPYPRLHFALTHSSPLSDKSAYEKAQISVKEITRELFDIENQLTNCDPRKGQFIACYIQYRGDLSPVDINKAINSVKGQINIEFVDWCPTGFKIGISSQPPASPLGSDLAQMTRNATMLSNTSAISQIWDNLVKQFDWLYSRKAFLHWFVGEGLEEREFHETRETILQLKMDYHEMATTSEKERINENKNNEESDCGYIKDISEDDVRHSESVKHYSVKF